MRLVLIALICATLAYSEPDDDDDDDGAPVDWESSSSEWVEDWVWYRGPSQPWYQGNGEFGEWLRSRKAPELVLPSVPYIRE